MHEWALAEAILASAKEAAAAEHLKEVTEIHMLIGELQQLDKGILRLALRDLAAQEGPLFSKVRFVFRTEKAMLTCHSCGLQWPFRDLRSQVGDQEAESIHFIPEVALVYARCPRCKSPDFHITKGRGITLASVRGRR